MPAPIKYKKGDKLGPNNIVYLEEADPYVSGGRNYRRGKFICPLCGETWETLITYVKNGKIKSCGCNRGIGFTDFTGQRFGKLTVLEPTSQREYNHIVWKCICDCGQIIYVGSQRLRQARSCGCARGGALDLTNKKFGKLLCLEPTEQRSNGSIIWKCLCDCGHIAYVAARDLTLDWTSSCGCLKESKGCNIITNFLDKNKILYIKEYKFSDCKDIRPLPFDFYLPDYNICIEYDGQQHFRPVQSWGGEKTFQNTKKHDKIKNQYCKNNNIRLIRIPYWDYNKLNEEYLLSLINDKKNT